MLKMPEARIILVRHGETEANRQRHFAASDDIPLTDTGRDQAHALALRLAREFRPQLLVSSEFLRARQTSEIIARILGLAPFTIKGIHERDFGCLKGLPYEKLGELMSLDRPIQPWMWRPAGGESLEDVRCRSMHAIDALRDQYPDREIVVVCHGAVIQAVCAHITGEWHESPATANCGIVTITAQGILVCE
jgi:broad specificity phosphatase PhoE